MDLESSRSVVVSVQLAWGLARVVDWLDYWVVRHTA